MENVKFIDYTMTRLDELKKETGKSSFSNAKSNFKKALQANIAAEPSLSDVFTNKQAFNQYGKLFSELIKKQECLTAQRENREIDSKKISNKASAAKGALKPIFEIIGKEVKNILAGQKKAKARDKSPDGFKFDGMDFVETLEAVCRLAFPKAEEIHELAASLETEIGIHNRGLYKCWITGFNTPIGLYGLRDIVQNTKILTQIESMAGVQSGTLTKFMPSGIALVDMDDMASYAVLPEDRIRTKYEFSSSLMAHFDSLTRHMMGIGSSRKVTPAFAEFQHHSDLQDASKAWTINGENECRAGDGVLKTLKIYRQWLMDTHVISDPMDFKEQIDFTAFFKKWLIADEFKIKHRGWCSDATKRRRGEAFIKAALTEPSLEQRAIILFIEEKGLDVFTELEGFIDFDLSYLLVEEYVEDFITSRINSGVTTSVGHFIKFISSCIGGRKGDSCYLSLFHAPVDLMEYPLDKGGYDAWKKDERSLEKLLNKHTKIINKLNDDKSKEDENGVSIGKRNIAYFVNAEVRERFGLSGGIKEGADEYQSIIELLEKEGDVFGNNYFFGNVSIGYQATMVAMFMRLMYQQPMRLGNWQSLRLVTYKESLKSKVPCIWKHKGSYHLKVQPRFVKNNRFLRTDFTTAMTKYIDNYLAKRDARLKERNATSDRFLISTHGGLFNAGILSNTTYKAMKVLWPERDFITWGFNPHSLRHFVATLYLADNPNDIYRCAELIQDSPQTVIDNYIEKDSIGIAQHHSSWASQYD